MKVIKPSEINVHTSRVHTNFTKGLWHDICIKINNVYVYMATSEHMAHEISMTNIYVWIK